MHALIPKPLRTLGNNALERQSNLVVPGRIGPSDVLADLRRQFVQLARRPAAPARLRERGANSVKALKHRNLHKAAAELAAALRAPLLRCVCNQAIARRR